MWYEIQQENLCANAYLNSLCTQFLVELNRSVSDSNIVSAQLDYRIAIAQSMIAQGYSLKDVATQCGFADYSTFYKLFRKQLGVSPSEYCVIAPSNHLNN